MRPVPRIETPRLRLRMPDETDFPAYFDFMRSERSRYMGGPFEPWPAWGMLCHDIACWTLFGHGALMLDRLSDGQCVGQVGINHGPMFPEKELGWLLYEGHEGQGYATEAASALRDWAFGELGLTTLVSYCHPANLASIAVARRLGGVVDETAARQDADDVVLRYHPTRA